MNNGNWTLPIILGIIAVILLYAVSVYNGLVRLRNRVRNAWAQIDVQLKTRADLIPNLVETVKGYAAHERGTFEEVVRARNQAVSAKTVQEAADANNNLTAALQRLMVVVEAYPTAQGRPELPVTSGRPEGHGGEDQVLKTVLQ